MGKTSFNGRIDSYLLILFIAAFVSFRITFAQQHQTAFRFSVAGGVSFPVSTFSEANLTKLGYAENGYSARVDIFGRLGKYVSLATSFVGTAQGYNTERREKDLLQLTGTNFRVSADSYKTLWLLTGLHFSSEDIPLYLLAQAGILLPIVPDIRQRAELGENVVSSISKIAFAYSAGAGFRIHDFDVSVRYYFSSPEVEERIQNYIYFRPYTTNIAVITGTIGYSF